MLRTLAPMVAESALTSLAMRLATSGAASTVKVAVNASVGKLSGAVLEIDP